MPLVSVVVRSMDRPTLARALASVGNQTYPQVEVVVVNARGAAHSPLPPAGILPVRLVDLGVPLPRSRAANMGLQAARGDLLVLLDDDDWFDPSHLERLVFALRQHQGSVAAYAGVRCLHEGEGETRAGRVFDEPFDPVRLLAENYIPVHALLFRRSVLEGPEGCRFDEAFDLFEDWDFLLQLRTRGPFVHCPGISANYSIHEGAGEGVQADSTRAARALDQVLAKWPARWSPEDRRDLIARLRLQARLLEEANAALTTANQARDGALIERDGALAAVQTLNETLTDANRARDESLQALWASEQERERILQSTSWRITAPLRALARRVRSAKAACAQFRPKGALLSLLRRLYRSRRLAGLRPLVPAIVKRRLLHVLSRESVPRAQPVFSGRLSEHPLVSLVVPVFNHADYLAQCLQSALDQTYDALEVVVVDDASTDPRVGEILARFRSDPRLVLLSNPQNMGISRSQNRALKASRGEIIAFLDCDDFLAPDAVETCLRYWQPDTVYSHSARINIGPDGKEINRICFQDLPRQDYFAENLEAMYATHFKMVRRDVFARVGLFDARFDTAQDYDLLMRAAFHHGSAQFRYVPHFVYTHRLHGGQATETATRRQAQAVDIIKREARLRRDIRAGQFHKRLSFIMLSFGKYNQTLEALKSLKATVRVPHEIILLDNGSDAETVAFLKEHVEGQFADLTVHYAEHNLGPAQGRRQALSLARGDWFVVFDNDELAEAGWLEELLVRACSDPAIAAVTAKIIFPDGALQCCGGYAELLDDGLVNLALYSRGQNCYDLETAEFRDCDWCPIGATLFTVNPAPFLHAGYPNIFEDAGVSFALRHQGHRLVNSPASWVWHEHVAYQKEVKMGPRYLKERYDPRRMLTSLASFYRENGLVIHDEYVWRENRLSEMDHDAIRALLEKVAAATYPPPGAG